MDTIPFSYFMMVAPVEILVAFTLLYLQLGKTGRQIDRQIDRQADTQTGRHDG